MHKFMYHLVGKQSKNQKLWHSRVDYYRIEIHGMNLFSCKISSKKVATQSDAKAKARRKIIQWQT